MYVWIILLWLFALSLALFSLFVVHFVSLSVSRYSPHGMSTSFCCCWCKRICVRYCGEIVMQSIDRWRSHRHAIKMEMIYNNQIDYMCRSSSQTIVRSANLEAYELRDKSWDEIMRWQLMKKTDLFWSFYILLLLCTRNLFNFKSILCGKMLHRTN